MTDLKFTDLNDIDPLTDMLRSLTVFKACQGRNIETAKLAIIDGVKRGDLHSIILAGVLQEDLILTINTAWKASISMDVLIAMVTFCEVNNTWWEPLKQTPTLKVAGAPE